MRTMQDGLADFIGNRRNHLVGMHKLPKRLVVAVITGTPENWTFDGTLAVVSSHTEIGGVPTVMLRSVEVDLDGDYVSSSREWPHDPGKEILVSADALARYTLFVAKAEPVHS